MSTWFRDLFNPGLDWDDFAWIRENWAGRIAVKGILAAEDAAIAARAGTDAVIVSNHGGRQYDGAPATLDVLPEVVQALGETPVQVLLDSGVRTGADVAVAIASGADAVLIGRPWLYGLAAGGKDGVARVLEILESQLRTAMQLLGCPDLASLSELRRLEG